MLLDPRAKLRQSKDLTVREGGTVLVRGELDPFGAAARSGHDGDALVPQAALDYLPGRGVRDEVVRVDRPRDDGLAEAGAGVYNGLMALPVTGLAVNRTPATEASTIRCTTTASRTPRGSIPFVAR